MSVSLFQNPHSNLAFNDLDESVYITDFNKILCSKKLAKKIKTYSDNFDFECFSIVYDGKVITYEELMSVQNALSVHVHTTSFVILLDTGRLIYIELDYNINKIIEFDNKISQYNITNIFSNGSFLLITVVLPEGIPDNFQVFWVHAYPQFNTLKSVKCSGEYTSHANILIYVKGGSLHFINLYDTNQYPQKIYEIKIVDSKKLVEEIVNDSGMLLHSDMPIMPINVVSICIYKLSIYILLTSDVILHYSLNYALDFYNFDGNLYSEIHRIGNIKCFEFIQNSFVITLDDNTVIVKVMNKDDCDILNFEYKHVIKYVVIADMLCLVHSNNTLSFTKLNKIRVLSDTLETIMNNIQSENGVRMLIDIQKVIKIGSGKTSVYMLCYTSRNTLEAINCISFRKIHLSSFLDLGLDSGLQKLTELQLKVYCGGSYI